MDKYLICELCKTKYDDNQRLPLTLLCSHTICRSCLENLRKLKMNNCPKCQQDVKIQNKRLSQFIPNKMILESLKKSKMKKKLSESSSEYFSSSNSEMYSSKSQSDGENQVEEENEGDEESDRHSKTKSSTSDKNKTDTCIRHKDKLIEFFCQTCTQAVCVNCIFFTHNGHTLTSLSEMSTIIKQNIFDFSKLLTKLQKINIENYSLAQTKLEELQQMQEIQRDIVSKTFEEIFYVLEDKKNDLLKEFDKKYNHEHKRFAKLNGMLANSLNETQKIKEVSEQLEVFVKSHSDATLLKKVDEFTMFLHKSYMDIKRLYKTEISLKAELRVDPNMNPILINSKNIISFINKIDPKVVCFSPEIKEKNEEKNKRNESLIDKLIKIKTNSSPDNFSMPNLKYLNNKDYNYTDQAHMTHITEESGNSNVNDKENSLNTNLDKKKYFSRSNSRGNSYSSKFNALMRDSKKSLVSPNKVHNKYFPNETSIDENIEDKFENNNFVENKNKPVLKSFMEFSQDRKAIFNLSNEKEESSNFSKSTKINTKNETTITKVLSIKNTQENIESVQIKNQLESPYILCIGDTNYFLKYNLEHNTWESINTENKSLGKNQSNDKMRFSSLISIGNSRFIMTGGCHVSNQEASSICCELKLLDNEAEDKRSNFFTISLKPMNKRRYAHSSIHINGDVYVCGGFDHKDDQMASPSTLRSCEKYSITDNKWRNIASFNTARGFFGMCLLNRENIFAFGGFSDEQVLNSIEKYDILSDTWISYFLKLPDKLAKINVINMNDKSILILGGINSNYELVNKVIELNLSLNKFENCKEMLYARSFNQSAFLYDNYVYVTGNNPECNCEKYNMLKQEWHLTESYTSQIRSKKMNELYNFCFALNYDD